MLTDLVAGLGVGLTLSDSSQPAGGTSCMERKGLLGLTPVLICGCDPGLVTGYIKGQGADRGTGQESGLSTASSVEDQKPG